ncbi:DUF2958 domain-containing protein [Novosphingobium sp. TCA1]|jgi:hypothetical protein|uniref:DUF2958 domain-containing protein n=1 Tax=Novosphingobium sp. TCA1 TaxID=2682474 RepID=UPI001308F8C7|nr:DUF2958 domain-containing protein [Novosphingobium sp. TCA1]GFE72397.1 single-stranded DNA endonuclease [Novosphingobium sp. TCA1]
MTDWTELLRPETRIQLLKNHKEQEPRKGRDEIDFNPVAKLFVPWGAATFLISECDGDGLAFGLSDLGFGSPELGYISLDELAEITGPGGLRVEEDIHFRADKPLSKYAEDARAHGRIRA